MMTYLKYAKPASMLLLCLASSLASAAPDVATLISPIEKVKLTEQPEFRWADQPDATIFKLRVYDRVLRTTVHLQNYNRADVCSSGVCSVRINTDLNFSTNHFFRVRSRDAAGWAAWSAYGRFGYVDEVPGRVTTVAPTGQINTELPAYTFSAVERATQYQLYIRDITNSTTITNTRYQPDDVCDTSGNCFITPPASASLEGTSDRTFFLVRAHNTGGAGQWSARKYVTYTPNVCSSVTPYLDEQTIILDEQCSWMVQSRTDYSKPCGEGNMASCGPLDPALYWVYNWTNDGARTDLTVEAPANVCAGVTPYLDGQTIILDEQCSWMVQSRSDYSKPCGEGSMASCGPLEPALYWVYNWTNNGTRTDLTVEAPSNVCAGFTPYLDEQTIILNEQCSWMVQSRSDYSKPCGEGSMASCGPLEPALYWIYNWSNDGARTDLTVATDSGEIAALPVNDAVYRQVEFAHFQSTPFDGIHNDQVLDETNTLVTRQLTAVEQPGLTDSNPDSTWHADNWYATQPAGEEDGFGNFRVGCQWSHFNFEDAIVYPGERNAPAHLHMYFGNTDANHNTIDATSLTAQGGGTCDGFALNRSAYWVPAMMKGMNMRTAVLPKEFIAYYKTRTVCDNPIAALPHCTHNRDTGAALPNGGDTDFDGDAFDHDTVNVVEMPQGLELISGNGAAPDNGDPGGVDLDLMGAARGSETSPFVFWSCGKSGSVLEKFNRIPSRDVCMELARAKVAENLQEGEVLPPDSVIDDDVEINATIYFPQCWTGNDADLETGEENEATDRTAWTYVRQVDVDGKCPADYRSRMPQLGFLIYWSLDGVTTTDDWYLSSDMSMNGGTMTFSGNPGGSLHGDWMAGWHEDVMTSWVEECLQKDRNCTFGQTGTRHRLREAGQYQITDPSDYFVPVPTLQEIRQ